jgi:hypothetical protein
MCAQRLAFGGIHTEQAPGRTAPKGYTNQGTALPPPPPPYFATHGAPPQGFLPTI